MQEDRLELKIVDVGRMGQGTVPHQELRLHIAHPRRTTIRIGTVCATERRIQLLREIIVTGCRVLNIPYTVVAPARREASDAA